MGLRTLPGVCCVDPLEAEVFAARSAGPGSEAHREFGERDTNSIIGGQGGGEFVVATAQVLHERVPGLRPRLAI